MMITIEVIRPPGKQYVLGLTDNRTEWMFPGICLTIKLIQASHVGHMEIHCMWELHIGRSEGQVLVSAKGKDASWNLEDEATYETLDDDISESMKHAERICNMRKAHATPWTKFFGQATHSIRYWDARITRRGIRENDDPILDYYLLRSSVDKLWFGKTLTITACIHKLNNVRSQLIECVRID
jgi:hypothetical protein